MSAEEDFAADSITQFDEATNNYSREHVSMVENARWLVTLILGEFVALASYQRLQEQKSLGIAFTIVSFVLCVPLTCFIFSVIYVRFQERRLRRSALFSQYSIKSLLKQDLAPSDLKRELTETRDAALQELLKVTDGASIFESLGLGFFAAATLLSGVIVFMRETISMLFR